MDTRYETTSDNKTDTRSINADVGTDVSEELTNDEGVDLNALNDESSNEEKTLGKAFFAEYAPPLPVNDAIYAEAPANVTNDASPFTEEGQSRMIDEGQGPAPEIHAEHFSEPESGIYDDPPDITNDDSPSFVITNSDELSEEFGSEFTDNMSHYVENANRYEDEQNEKGEDLNAIEEESPLNESPTEPEISEEPLDEAPIEDTSIEEATSNEVPINDIPDYSSAGDID